MWVMDLSELDAVAPFALRADDELGGIDLLVNNAGIPKRRHALQLTPDVVDDVMAINYSSPVRLTLALLPRMIERGRGRILTISSGRRGSVRHVKPRNSASKAALSAFMESLAVDLDGTDIKINLVNPASSTPSCSICPTTRRRSRISTRCRSRRSSTREAADR